MEEATFLVAVEISARPSAALPIFERTSSLTVAESAVSSEKSILEETVPPAFSGMSTKIPEAITDS